MIPYAYVVMNKGQKFFNGRDWVPAEQARLFNCDEAAQALRAVGGNASLIRVRITEYLPEEMSARPDFEAFQTTAKKFATA